MQKASLLCNMNTNNNCDTTTTNNTTNTATTNNITTTPTNNTNTTNNTSTTNTTASGDIHAQSIANNPQVFQTAISTHQNGSLHRTDATEYSRDLKICGYIKNIEKINEKRRLFLSNTITSRDEVPVTTSIATANSSVSSATFTITSTTTTTTTTGADDSKNNNNTNNNNSNYSIGINNNNHNHNNNYKNNSKANNITARQTYGKSDGLHYVPEPRLLQIREEKLEPKTDLDLDAPKYTTPLKSPATPPPKPPMLSRTRSIGVGDSKGSILTPTTSEVTVGGSLPQAATATATATATAAATTTTTTDVSRNFTTADVNSTDKETKTIFTRFHLPDTVKITTVQLKEDTPVLRRIERPMSATPEKTHKQISVNHYERLIEELKCPGCAYPMKAPVLLCKTGHSICEQCTRVLLMCPLCKESFTNIRSLTVEALCSKAHFRCSNAAGGCTVRLQMDLLGWHEKQCIYKPMKCFMGRVWGDCQWSGREAYWKEHLEAEHADKVFTVDAMELVWHMGAKQKPLTGYYVFVIFGEMFNFYVVYDKERVLFTMTCTSTIREKKHNFAFEVTLIHEDNDALAITQKFPVHSEYDTDILAEGTCVNIALQDLAKFITDEKVLHYRVRIVEVKSPRKLKISNHSSPRNSHHPIDFQQTKFEGVNLKNVPSDVIVTRREELPYADGVVARNGAVASSSEDELEKIRRQYNQKQTNDSDSDTDPEFEAFVAKKWGTPQMHFNRKYLKTTSSDTSSNDDAGSQGRNGDALFRKDKRYQVDDKASICSTNTSYKKKMTNSLRKSFRSLKTEMSGMKPFSRKSSEKSGDK